ncbi:MAG: amidohydrolase [Rhizobiaceae bacterium MnEN-MB40S]|nr:MAG: amidohydrolase [Rhizobiaceae bacterium MnEN-MB40S]
MSRRNSGLREDNVSTQTGSEGEPVKLISVEESFLIPEIIDELKRLAGGVPSMKSGPIAGPFMPRLLDIGAGRIAEMDADGVDIQVLAVSAPGVQKFDPETGLSLARRANDRLHQAIAEFPDRFAGLAVAPPQAAAEAAKELERAITVLGLNGLVINSHTNDKYLDDEKFWPLLEAAEALNVPVYLHPREPGAGLEKTLMAMTGFTVGWGYAVETGTHALRMIAAGVFERFPNLQIVLGHLGETLPFLLDRIDNRYPFEVGVTGIKPLPKKPSEYFRSNFTVSTSGMNFPAPLRAAIDILGADRIMFAADYPMEDQRAVVQDYNAIELTPEERRQISELTARRVFSID